ncbi:isopentenyl monophosphate kinase [Candidatus Blochmanniella floridana]|uniref:Isopentenyl monophosphate kinase n=1 Tax=Blochmanniella floridana TaxID=203907 RepID=Q7VR75_BLOFL|nr:isopentenyl monophosphate kinase [Candidatus Blochmannia floridanus]
MRLFKNMGNTLSKDNLIMNIAQLLSSYCGIKTLGSDMILNTKIPIGSELRGCSSNAATALVVLNYRWKCLFKKSVLVKLGLMLKANFPVFVSEYLSLREGLEEKFISVSLPKKKWYVTFMSCVQVNTSQIFNIYILSGHNYSPYGSRQELSNIPFHNDLDLIVRQIFSEIEIYSIYLSRYTSIYLTEIGYCIFPKFINKNLRIKYKKSLLSYIRSIITKGVYTYLLYIKYNLNILIMFDLSKKLFLYYKKIIFKS